ncbi:MAG: YitT family protein [Bacteroidales bacterium]
MQTINWGKFIKEYTFMTFALAVYVFGWVAFIIPFGFPGGGVAGFASILFYGFNIPISYSYFSMNVVLLAIGFAVLGKGFGVKTIYCIIITSLLFEYLPQIIAWRSDIQDKLINAIIGGAFSGIGIGVVFKQGGSTGGTDVIALIINKYREVSPGKVFLVLDSLIITSILLLPDKGLQDVIYGYIEIIAFTYTIDLLLTGSQQSVRIEVMSNNSEEVADSVCTKIGRGVTVLNSTGWHTKTENKVLVIVVRKGQMQETMDQIHKADPHAFINVSSVMGVYGNGFDKIRGN